SLAVRGVESHPPLQAPRLHRAPRLRAHQVPAGRLPAQALRRPASLEERHACRGASRQLESSMNLYAKLLERKDHPLRIGLIGAGKLAAMYLAQVPRTPGVELVAIADLSPANAKENLKRVGWDPQRIPPIIEDWEKLVSNPKIDIVIEATGNPIAAVEHIL